MNYYPEEFDKEDYTPCLECGEDCEGDYCNEQCWDNSNI